MTTKTKTSNNRPDRGVNRKKGNAPGLTAEEKRELLAKQYKLKPKTKAFVDKLIDDPKLSQTAAYLATHQTTNRAAAGVEASKLLKKPSVIGYKASAVGKAKRRIIELVDSDNDNTALKAAQDIIDRTEGKAIQKNETTNRVIEVKLDLTGVKIGNHYIPQADRQMLES